MSEECRPSDCQTCGADCASRQGGEPDFRAKLSGGSSVKHVYAVMSGKGGVGKTLVTCMLAECMARRGHRTAVLDADITGPSVPKAFGISRDDFYVNQDSLMLPVVSKSGVSIVSSNLLLEHETDPIVWRGSLIASAIKQFYSESLWEDIEYMFVDMPPGTGDVPLTVFQSLPVEGIIMVTSPQELVSMIVEKAVNMARKMSIPILGIVENMSYLKCPCCGERISVFGESNIDATAKEQNLSVLAKLPIDPCVAGLIDSGKADEIDVSALDDTAKLLEALSRF